MKFFCIILFLCAAAHVAYGQAESGLELEYRFGLLTDATHFPGVVNQFFVPGTGSSVEHTIRLGYEHEIASFGSGVTIQAGAGAAYSSGNFHSDPFPGSSEEFTLACNVLSVYLRSGVTTLLDPFSLAFGGWVAIPLTRSLNESLLVNGSSATIASNSAIEYTRVPAGLRIELNYVRDLFYRVPLSAGLFSELDLDAYRQMRFKAMSGGVTLRWSLEQHGSILSPY